ncbi:hypothetical protein AAGG74_17170 [Bacillus mexicanus]|uniref:hypothetical protein n=1 Tax=Bacillus mexicanus TaxID=2834415 RepID=UPI003D1B3CD4
MTNRRDNELPEEMKQQMRDQLKNVSRENLIEHYINTAYKLHNLEIENGKLTTSNNSLKTNNRELRKQNLIMRTRQAEVSMPIEHFNTKKKVSFSSKSYKKAREKVNSVFLDALNKGKKLANNTATKGKQLVNSAVTKGKDMKEDFILERKKNYHSRFQKTRALLKSSNELVLKPVANLTAQKYKESKKSIELIHNKVNIEMSKQDLNKQTALNYSIMYAAAASDKMIEKSGVKKIANVAANSKLIKGIKNAYNKAVSNYRDNVEANKSKAASIEQKIESKKESKKALAK